MVSFLLFGYIVLKHGVSSLLNTVQLFISFLVIHQLILIMVASHCVCVWVHVGGWGGGGEAHVISCV